MRNLIKILLLFLLVGSMQSGLYAQYQVSGCTDPDINGIYLETGTYNGNPSYTNGTNTIFYQGCNTQWGIASSAGSCPDYSTRISGSTPPNNGWSPGGGYGGAVSDDQISVAKLNSIAYEGSVFIESVSDDGTFEDTLNILLYAESNTFTGANGDDFVAAGKIVVANLPSGLTAVVSRTSDTTLKAVLNGTAVNHEKTDNIANLTFTFQNSAFSGNDASVIDNTEKSDINVIFMEKYLVLNASTSALNDTFLVTGIHNSKPFYSNGTHYIFYKGCLTTWAIGDGSNGCPISKTEVSGDYPPISGWYDETLNVYPANSLLYSKGSFVESESNDGSIDNSNPLTIKYILPKDGNIFSGTNSDDFVADGKVVVSNLPAGLVAVATRTSDTSLVVVLTGAATSHSFHDNVSNLTFTFQNTAFSSGDASNIENINRNDLNVLFQLKCEVFDAESNTSLNGTYLASGMFNDKPVFSFGNYRLGYRDCNSKWVIVDGNDANNLNEGYCPQSKTEQDGDLPPQSGWEDEPLEVILHNSLYYSKTTFIESTENDGTIDNSDTLTIRYFLPSGSAIFSGSNGDDFVAANKITVSNLPAGLTAIAKRTSDTTIAVVVNGSVESYDVNNLTFAFNDNAFNGITASEVVASIRNDLKIMMCNEFIIASSGGDFETISAANNNSNVGDGDVLIVAAETFTENTATINKSLTIRGQGVGKTILQPVESPGTASNRIFFMIFDYSKYGNVTIENVTIQNGYTSTSGGAIYSSNCNLTIRNCEFLNNGTTSTYGGAIYTYQGSFISENCTFSNNSVVNTSTSTGYGGGALYLQSYNSSDSALILNCTFSENSAANQYGGALWSNHNLEIINSTFTDNTALYGGGIYRNSRTIDMVNVLVANNSATTSGPDIYGSVNANYCLIEDISDATITGANNVTESDPELLALADNGGSTKTCAISSTSKARDAGTNTDAPELDQRGQAIVNGIKDIGSYEYIPLPTGSDSSIVVLEDSIEYFTQTNFRYFDEEGDPFAGIIIISEETKGILEYDGADVTVDQECDDVTKLSFRPETNENGNSYSYFKFKVRDDQGTLSFASYTMTINVTPVNDAPTCENSIPDGSAQVGVAYGYEVPTNTFADIDVGDVLTYSASLGDGNGLPDWLSFNGTTRTFSGTPTIDGEITLKVTATDEGSSSISDQFKLTIAEGSTGIDDIFGNNLRMYPNPSNGAFTVELMNYDKEIRMIITNVSGKVVVDKTLEETKTNIDLSNHSQGVYFIRLTSGDKSATRKIVIQ